jgi:hypothetical protein
MFETWSVSEYLLILCVHRDASRVTRHFRVVYNFSIVTYDSGYVVPQMVLVEIVMRVLNCLLVGLFLG